MSGFESDSFFFHLWSHIAGSQRRWGEIRPQECSLEMLACYRKPGEGWNRGGVPLWRCVCVCVWERKGCAQVEGSSEREAVTCNHFLPLPSSGICRLTMPLSVFRLIQVNRWIYPERSQRRGLINTLKDGTGSRGGIHLSPTTWPRWQAASFPFD